MKPLEKLGEARLILVTDPRPDLARRVRAAVRGGVDIVQLRDKHVPREGLLALAEELRGICEEAGAIFTVNDDVELARSSRAHGVHLGQEDGLLAEARNTLGPDTVVGRSVGSAEEAIEAVKEGADYLGVGTIYATPTKPKEEAEGPTLLREVADLGLIVPWFAIGGITRETAEEAAAAGAYGFAVVRAVLDADDPVSAARELRSILEDPRA